MPVCSICAETCQDASGVQNHEWRKHREAYLANKPTWHVRYKAPAADLPFCALCELFIGREATFSHLSNPGHLARSSSSSVGQSPHVSQAQAAEMSTSGGDLWEEPASFSRRPRARLASNEYIEALENTRKYMRYRRHQRELQFSSCCAKCFQINVLFLP